VLVTPLPYGAPVPLFHTRLPGFATPRRGDLVLVRPPYLPEEGGIGLILDSFVRFVTLQKVSIQNQDRNVWENSNMIKRVVALPGDSVYMKDFLIYVKTAGSAHFLTEYEVGSRIYDLKSDGMPKDWDPSFPFSGTTDPVVLGPGQYYVIGDNRTASSDSRNWGPIDEKNILGMVLLRYWPFGKFGTI
jgi:signal peptidase I